VGLELATLIESDKCRVRVESLPEASRNSKHNGSWATVTEPNRLA
jgi:hypothetical protein